MLLAKLLALYIFIKAAISNQLTDLAYYINAAVKLAFSQYS